MLLSAPPWTVSDFGRGRMAPLSRWAAVAENHELGVGELGHGSLLGVRHRMIAALPPPVAPPVTQSGHRAGRRAHDVN